MTREAAIKKIQLLRRLAVQAGTAQEASAAASKAWELKQKHGLSEDDITPRPVPIRPAATEKVKTKVVAKRLEPTDVVMGAADEFVRKQHPIVQGVYAQYRSLVEQTIEELFMPDLGRRRRAR